MLSDLITLMIALFVLVVAIGFIATLSGLKAGQLCFILAGFEGFFIAYQAFVEGNVLNPGNAGAIALGAIWTGLSIIMILIGIQAVVENAD